MRKQVASEQPLCPDCEAEGRVTAWFPVGELDHVLALSHGGTNDRGNLVGRCKRHHLAKTARDMGHRPKPARGCDAHGWPTEPEHSWNR